MTTVYFKDGVYLRHEGGGDVRHAPGNLNLSNDNFMLFGDIGNATMSITNGSLDAQNATIINEHLYVHVDMSKAENINNADWIRLYDNGSLSNSSANELTIGRGKNTIDGVVSVKTVAFYNGTLSIAKNGLLKVGDKNTLEFEKISGEGKIYWQKQHAYYNTKNEFLGYDTNIDLFALNAGDGNETFSFDGATLTLNKGYEFTLFGDKAINIVNNATISKADISGTQLKSISGEGSIKELILSTNANPVINTNVEHVNPLNLNLNALENSNGSLYNFNGYSLTLNKGYEFILSGNKPEFITNNGVILKAEINGTQLKSIKGSGSINELHLSNNANLSLNCDFGEAVIEKGSMLYLYKQVDFSKLSGDGRVNINGTIYDTSGNALNNANSSLEANIKEHNFAMAKAIEKAQKYSYVDKAQQGQNVELLNIEAVNSDALI